MINTLKTKAHTQKRVCIIIIDNYDSFTYNIVQYVGAILQSHFFLKSKSFTKSIHIFKNDQISIDKIEKLQPTHIIISPGPGNPEQAGISKNVISSFYKKVPILGVCLGHQCIAEVFGATVVHAKQLFHGKTSLIMYNNSNQDIFRNCKNPFLATRYHSLVVAKSGFPQCLSVTAVADTVDKEIMALKHKKYPLFGVQFHPESILTKEGTVILENFLFQL